jgi:hypothetical protein
LLTRRVPYRLRTLSASNPSSAVISIRYVFESRKSASRNRTGYTPGAEISIFAPWNARGTNKPKFVLLPP